MFTGKCLVTDFKTLAIASVIIPNFVVGRTGIVAFETTQYKVIMP